MTEEEPKVQSEEDVFNTALKDLHDNPDTESLEEQPESGATEQEEKPQPVQEVEVDGEKVPLETIKEWKSGTLRLADYTRKTQELARERDRITLMRQALEDEFYNRKEYTPAPAQPNQYQPVSEEPLEFATPTEKRLYDELQQVKGAVGSLYERDKQERVRTIQAQIDDSINGFMKAHPDMNEDQVALVIEKSRELGMRKPSLATFEHVHRGMRDEAEIEKRAIEKYEAEKKKKPLAQMEPPSSIGAAPAMPDLSKLTEDQIYALMERDLKMHQ